MTRTNNDNENNDNLIQANNLTPTFAVPPPLSLLSTFQIHRCTLCKHEFSKASGLKRHMRVHAGGGKNNSGKKQQIPFAGNSKIQQEQQQENSNSAIYSCQFCNKQFYTIKQLENHFEMDHSRNNHHLIHHPHAHLHHQALKCSQCGCFRPVTPNSETKPLFKCETCVTAFKINMSTNLPILMDPHLLIQQQQQQQQQQHQIQQQQQQHLQHQQQMQPFLLPENNIPAQIMLLDQYNLSQSMLGVNSLLTNSNLISTPTIVAPPPPPSSAAAHEVNNYLNAQQNKIVSSLTNGGGGGGGIVGSNKSSTVKNSTTESLMKFRINKTKSSTNFNQDIEIKQEPLTDVPIKQEFPQHQQSSSVAPTLKQYNCAECGKGFSHASTLAMHKKHHTGDYKYICEYCDKTFILCEYYTRHVRVHTKEKPYKCEICEKSFSQSNTLTQHRRIHTGEKPYECTVCGRAFSVRDYLNKHMRTHTGEKPYRCNVCDKRYSQASGLRTHKKQHSHFTMPMAPAAAMHHP